MTVVSLAGDIGKAGSASVLRPAKTMLTEVVAHQHVGRG